MLIRLLIRLFLVGVYPDPTSGVLDPQVRWHVSKTLLEEGSTAVFEVQLDQANDDTVEFSLHWSVVTESGSAIDPSRIEMPPVVLLPGRQYFSAELTLPRDQRAQVDTDAILTLTSEEPSLAGLLDKAQRITLLDVAPDSVLWMGIEDLFKQDSVFVALNNHRRIHFPWVGLPTWVVPPDPTWQEDPFNDNAWQVYYQSLVWLIAYGRGFELTGELRHLEQMSTLIFDYLETNPPGIPTEPPALQAVDSDHPEKTNWSSLTVAKRAETLLYLYRRYLESQLDPRQRRVLRDYIFQHGTFLHHFLNSDLSFQHNHGFIATRVLLKISHALPEMTADTGWRQVANRRISDYVSEMVDEDTGASTEQAMYYHYFAMELFTRMHLLMQRLNEPVPSNMASVVNRMIEYGAITMYPDGTTPAYGDTKHGMRAQEWLSRLYDDSGTKDEIVEFVLTKSASGVPPERVSQYSSEGYVVIRPERTFSDNSAWLRQPVIFVDFGAPPRVHGHHDALSFLAYFQGEAILVDGSGPYDYMPEVRPFIVARSRGNALIVDGYESVDNAASVSRTYDWPGLAGATGQLTQQEVTLTRTVAWLDSRVLLIVDQADPHDERVHSYDLFHHFAPGATAAADGASFHVRTPRGLDVEQRTFASTDAELSVHLPSEVDTPLVSRGWITSGFKAAVPAPVSEVSVSARGTVWLITTFTALEAGAVSPIEVAHSGSDLVVSVDGVGVTYSLAHREFR